MPTFLSNANDRRPTAVAVAGGSLVVATAALTAFGILSGINSDEDQNVITNEKNDAKAIFNTYDPNELLLPLPPTASPVALPSTIPSISSSPSQIPSTSTVPSAEPSSNPTATSRPSSIPSESPSSSSKPSNEPSSIPSAIPSSPPSSQPSFSPSVSTEPTSYPTTSPTQSPTSNPTQSPLELLPSISSTGTFHLRLHWQQGFMWQESPEESWFCMACAWCDNDIFSEHCDIQEYCREDMMLALVKCDPGRRSNQNNYYLRLEEQLTTFTLLRGGGLFDSGNFAGDQIQVDGTNLCLHKSGPREMVLQNCDASVEAQRFLGFQYGGQGMELRPEGTFKMNGVVVDRCLTQHHHPRQGERVFAEACEKARSSDTNLWSAY